MQEEKFNKQDGNLDQPIVIGLAVKGAAVREIKFRAWDESEKQMRYNIGICPTKHPDRVNFTFMFGAEGCTANPLQVPIMQFTGIQNNDGEFIYEGDIVEYPTREDKKPCIGVVKFETQENCLGWYIYTDKTRLGLYTHMKLLGNIYENAGLLPL